MPYDPNKTDSWSINDVRRLESLEAKRRLREVYLACLGIGVMIVLVVLFVVWVNR